MMISQPALMWLDAIWNQLLHRQAASVQPAQEPTLEPPPTYFVSPSVEIVDAMQAPLALAVAVMPEQAPVGGSPPPLSADERRARAAALKALALSRARKFEAARLAFADAARLDPELDITRVPTFWSLERGAHEAAVTAYNDAGRTGDAAVLRARVQSTYRPKPLRHKAVVVTAP